MIYPGQYIQFCPYADIENQKSFHSQTQTSIITGCTLPEKSTHEKEPSVSIRTNKITLYSLSSHDMAFDLLYFKGTKSKSMK